jgi:hypothetical protein
MEAAVLEGRSDEALGGPRAVRSLAAWIPHPSVGSHPEEWRMSAPDSSRLEGLTRGGISRGQPVSRLPEAPRPQCISF